MPKLAVINVIFALFSYSALADVSLESLPDLQRSEAAVFDAERYFCDQYATGLETYDDAYKWLEFVRGLSLRETSVDFEDCYTPTVRWLQEGIWQQDNDMIATGNILGLIRGKLTGGRRDILQTSVETRYVNDAIALGYLFLACQRFQNNIARCFVNVLEKQPNILLNSSPVFCSFTNDTKEAISLQNTRGDALQLLSELPGSCVSLSIEGNRKKYELWWEDFNKFIGRSSATSQPN